MSKQIILDLGDEFGEILIESNAITDQVADQSEGLVKAGLADTTKRIGEKLRVNAGKVLQLPLAGLVHLFLETLPAPSSNPHHELTEFTVEFQIGVEVEAGNNLGVIAKVSPNGHFKCTYTWKTKATPTILQAT